MKKVLLLTLIAMLLFGTFAISACKPKVEDIPEEEVIEEEEPIVEDAPAEEAAEEEAPVEEAQ